MSFRILPALAALAAAIAKPFRRKPKVTKYEAPGPEDLAGRHEPSLRGNGKASRALRKARRLAVSRSFTRFYAHKPMRLAVERAALRDVPANEADERALDAAAAWYEGMRSWMAGWAKAAKESTTVRLGRRAQKLAHRMRRRREVAIMKRARRDVAAVDAVALALGLRRREVGQ